MRRERAEGFKARFVASLVLLLALAGVGVTPAAGDSTPWWPMRQHDAQQTGQSPAYGPTSPVLRWSRPAPAPYPPGPPAAFTAGVVVGADGTIYGGDMAGNAYAINSSGTIVHTYPGVGLCCAPPAIGPDGTIYFSGMGTTALRPDFSLKWKNPSVGICCGSLAVGIDGTVYVGNGSVTALDPASGMARWTFSPGTYGDTSVGCGAPAIGPDGTLFLSTPNSLFALTPAGSLRWRTPLANLGCVIPVVDPSGTVYVPSGNAILKFDASGYSRGQIAFEPNAQALSLALDNLRGTLVATVFQVYPGTPPQYGPGSLRAFSVIGTPLWSQAITGGTYAEPGQPVSACNPIIDGRGNIYLSTLAGPPTAPTGTLLYGFGPTGYSLFTPYSAPAVGMSDVRLLALDATGTLYQLANGALNAFGSPLPSPVITASAGLGGTISPAGPVSVPYGGSQTFQIRPSSGFHIDRLLVDGVSTQPAVAYTFAYVSSNHTINATFVPAVWPMRQRDAQHTGHAQAVGPMIPGLKWSVPGPGGFTGGTAIGPDGTIYAGDMAGNAVAINSAGWIMRSFPGVYQCCASPAVGPEGTIYFSGNGTTALNPDFTLKWKNPSVGICCGSLSVGPDGTVYVGNGIVTALDPADGHQKWTFTPSDGPGCGAPVLSPDGNTLYVATANYLYAIYPGGAIRWQEPIFNTGCVMPVVGPDGTVYVAAGSMIKKLAPTGYHLGYITLPPFTQVMSLALDADVGTLVCTVFDLVPPQPPTQPNPQYANGQVFAIRVSDGFTLWSRPIEGGTYAEPGLPGSPVSSTNPIIDRDGFVYLATQVGPQMPPNTVHLYGFDPSGNPIFNLVLPATLMSDPRLLSLDAFGTLYLLADGKLFAIGNGGFIGAEVNVAQTFGGSISPAGNVFAPNGSNLTFIVTPDSGMSVYDVVVDGPNHLGPVASYTFTNIGGYHTIQAQFGPPVYTITPSAGPGGSISPSAPQTVPVHGYAAFDFGPVDPRYGVDNLTVDGTTVTPTLSGHFEFTDVTANHTIAATFYGPVGVLTTNLPDGAIGTPYSQALTAAGGIAPYSWNVIGGTPPAALGLSPDGILSGVPVAGTYAFTVRATDARGAYADQQLVLLVVRRSQTISFGTLPNKTYGDLDFPVNAGTDSGLVVSFSAAGLCTVSGNLVHLTGVGPCTVTAQQAGDAVFNPAPDVSQSFIAAPRPITVAAEPKSKTYGTSDPVLTYHIASGSLVGGDTFTGALSRVPGEGAGTYVIAQGTVTAGANYVLAYVGAVLTINKADPLVTWSNPSDVLYGSPLGPSQLNATASVPGSFTYTPASGTVLNAGNGQTLSAFFAPADLANYNGAFKTVLINVAKAAPTITWATPASIVYGTALGAAQLNASASVPGTLAYTPAAGAVLGAGSQTLSVTFTPADAANYTGASKTVTLVVAKATPTLTWANPADLVYGAALGATQLNASASVPGSFAYTPAAGTVLNAGSAQTLSVTFTPTDAANYNSVSKNVAINVAKATPTITWANPASIAYGTALGATQLNATASVPGTFAYAPGTGTVLLPGTQTLSVTFTPTSANYNNASKTAMLVVTQSLTITTVSPLPAGYVGASYSQTLGATGGVPGYKWSLASGSTLPAGLTLNATTGVIGGTPTTTGAKTFTVQVADVNSVAVTKVFSLTISAARPDLIPTAVSGPTTGTRGKNISVSATVKNQGQAKAGSFNVTFYLSVDGVITATDTSLGSKSVTSLNAGSSTTVSGNLSIPSSAAAGTYFIGVIVDSGGSVTETDETNNSKAGNTISVK